jgi:hypothetical protein
MVKGVESGENRWRMMARGRTPGAILAIDIGGAHAPGERPAARK